MMSAALRSVLGLAILVMVAGCGAATEGEPTQQGSDEARATACTSSADCTRSNTHCSTDDGVCNRPPGCAPGDVCIAVCYGRCVRDARPAAGVTCGTSTCASGEFCCNESCGICAPTGGVCTQQFCSPPVLDTDAGVAPAPSCSTNADCRTFSDYCTGCDCRALSTSQPDPVCEGPGVRCFADPCMNHVAVCNAGTCTLE